MTESNVGVLLFKDGDWELRRRASHDTHGKMLRLWHKCDGYMWYVWTRNPQCTHCKKPPPVALIGLKTLHDWDR